MKRCLIYFLTCSLLTRVWGQSPSAAIDSLVKFRIVTGKERPMLARYLRHDKKVSYRVNVLGALEFLMIQKTLHVDPSRTGIFVSYRNVHIDKKSQDSIDTKLRVLLAKINNAGLLTSKVYTYAQFGVDTGRYMAELQMIGDLTEMSSRLEWLAPNRLLPVAQDLHQYGIVSDSSFSRLVNDINGGKIESVFQLNDYCNLDKVFDLSKYSDDPAVWLEQLHRDMASMLPGLNFTNFSYTEIPDTSFSIPQVRFKVSLVCNGRVYKHNSIPFHNYISKQAKITPRNIFVEDFYRIFNKILTDQQSPLRLHSIMFSRGNNDDHFRYFALIALSAKQAEVFFKEPDFDYMPVSMEDYDTTLTSPKIDSSIAQFARIGLFAHLSTEEISKATDNAEADDRFSVDQLLSNFPGVTYPLDSVWLSPSYPYAKLLRHLAQITHGDFTPTKIVQKKTKGGVKIQYLANGKIHSHTFNIANGWVDASFQTFLSHLSEVNQLPGKFYQLMDRDDIIYLNTQQHDYVVKHKLLDFAEPVAPLKPKP